jgi:hypothetical protein
MEASGRVKSLTSAFLFERQVKETGQAVAALLFECKNFMFLRF